MTTPIPSRAAAGPSTGVPVPRVLLREQPLIAAALLRRRRIKRRSSTATRAGAATPHVESASAALSSHDRHG